MRLVAGIAGKSGGVFRGSDLRETPGLGRVGLMAADAEYGGIELGGYHRSRVVGVVGQRSVTGFAIHMRMLAILFLVDNVGMASFASLVAGKIDGPGGDF